MKALLTLTITLTYFSILKAQEIEVGDTITIENVKITKVEGQTPGSGYTELKYIKPSYVIGYINERAENEMWTAKRKSDEIAFAKAYQKGGQLKLSIGRSTIGAADTEYFTIIVKKNNLEVLRKPLKHDSAEVPLSDGLWWNIAIVSIAKPLQLPFDVYVVDSLLSTKYHFRIMD